MKLSVIIPSRPSEPTLPRTLDSVKAAAAGLEVELIQVVDSDSKGLSWARNQGLDRATGELVFFVDADDTVKVNYFSRLSSALVASDADFILSSTDYCPLKRDYNLSGNRAIREVMLPAFFGYSLADVNRWNRGGDLRRYREQGGVWRCAFRHDFLKRHRIRFDEELRLFEDSPFIAECAARAQKVASICDRLYEYRPNPQGLMASSMGSDRYWQYKFAALRNRLAMAERIGGAAEAHFRASAVFSALELLKAKKDWRRYVAEPFVIESLERFPLSIRHPLVAAGVLVLRMRARRKR